MLIMFLKSKFFIELPCQKIKKIKGQRVSQNIHNFLSEKHSYAVLFLLFHSHEWYNHSITKYLHQCVCLLCLFFFNHYLIEMDQMCPDTLSKSQTPSYLRNDSFIGEWCGMWKDRVLVKVIQTRPQVMSNGELLHVRGASK
jgi:hypothetical protein